MLSRRLPVFDGLRGIAAIMVMLFHAELTFGIPTLFSRGYLFVDFFFLLSGFVLTLSMERKRVASTDFIWARVKRLWPLAAVGTVVGAVTATFIGEQHGIVLSLVLALLMIPSVLGSGRLFPLNGPQWSLFLELGANVVHVFVLRRLDDHKLRIAMLLSALSLATTIMLFDANILGPFAVNWTWALPRVAFSYILGIWFARKWMTAPRPPVLPWKLALVLPAVCVIVLPSLPMNIAVGDMLTTIVLFPALFWAAAVATIPRAAEIWLGWLGALSFPLYAIHLPIMEMTASIDSTAPSMVLAIAGSIVCALSIAQLNAALLARGKRRTIPIRSAAHANG